MSLIQNLGPSSMLRNLLMVALVLGSICVGSATAADLTLSANEYSFSSTAAGSHELGAQGYAFTSTAVYTYLEFDANGETITSSDGSAWVNCTALSSDRVLCTVKAGGTYAVNLTGGPDSDEVSLYDHGSTITESTISTSGGDDEIWTQSDEGAIADTIDPGDDDDYVINRDYQSTVPRGRLVFNRINLASDGGNNDTLSCDTTGAVRELVRLNASDTLYSACDRTTYS